MFGVSLYGVLEYGNELIGPRTERLIFPIYSNKKDYYIDNNEEKGTPQDTYNKKKY